MITKMNDPQPGFPGAHLDVFRHARVLIEGGTHSLRGDASTDAYAPFGGLTSTHLGRFSDFGPQRDRHRVTPPSVAEEHDETVSPK